MGSRDQLFEIADRQQGFFTSRQAEECLFYRPNFHLKIRSREWIKEQWGIYRLARYPLIDRSELVLWTLWSRNRKGEPQGVWSHETALDIHELSDVMPTQMHMSVPPRFRNRIKTPRLLHLHYELISEADIETRQGYQVTRPLRTLIDVMAEKKVSPEHIMLALREALHKGLISQREVEAHPQLVHMQEKYEI